MYHDECVEHNLFPNTRVLVLLLFNKLAGLSSFHLVLSYSFDVFTIPLTPRSLAMSLSGGMVYIKGTKFREMRTG